MNHDEMCKTIITDDETACDCLVGENRRLKAELSQAKTLLSEATDILKQAQVLHDLALCPACGKTNK